MKKGGKAAAPKKGGPAAAKGKAGVEAPKKAGVVHVSELEMLFEQFASQG